MRRVEILTAVRDRRISVEQGLELLKRHDGGRSGPALWKVTASPWWAKVLVAGGARREPTPEPPTRPEQTGPPIALSPMVGQRLRDRRWD